MKYVEVLVAEGTYHGKDALTYSVQEALQPGTVVSVPLRSKQVLGIVRSSAGKPKFAVKPVEAIFSLPPLPKETFALIEWLTEYYPAPFGAIVQLFLPNSLLNKHVAAPMPLASVQSPEPLPPLTTEQQAALDQIAGAGSLILHGETGSGKTRIYIELAAKALAHKRSAIILTPEIGLTSQLAEAFREQFGEQVIVVHSQLTEVARQKAWLQILRSDQPRIVIGPRSALFSPLRDLGLIVIDEAHENAYKQDQAPHYHANRVAAQLGRLKRAPVVLGSATPPVVDYFVAEQKKRPIIRMRELARASEQHHTDTTVVDLKDRTQFSKSAYLSKPLLTAVAQTLAKKEQVLLFLNRRGTARLIFCENCGWQAVCPHCDLPLVYHGDDHTMRCHTCSFKQTAVSSCPSCGNPSIIFKAVGTKAIAGEIAAHFPQARVQRFDTDNKRGERIEEHYGAVKNGDVDIIVGTQTLAKGLDLPNLGMVGVIAADTSLYLPDYNSEERTYQLLAQVLGRVGRGHRATHAVIQTYNPKSPLIKAVLARDWQRFYYKELRERETFLFPPFCYVLKLSCRRASIAGAQKAATSLANQLKDGGYKIIVEGPAPAFHEKSGDKYQWQLIAKAKNRGELLRVIPNLPSGWSYDIDPTNLL